MKQMSGLYSSTLVELQQVPVEVNFQLALDFYKAVSEKQFLMQDCELGIRFYQGKSVELEQTRSKAMAHPNALFRASHLEYLDHKLAQFREYEAVLSALLSDMNLIECFWNGT